MRCTWLAGNTGRKKIAKKSPSAHHHTTLSGCIFATKACIDNRKNLLNINISSICSLSVVNFGPLTAEIDWGVWGTPADFNRFRVLASLLHRRRSVEVNQTFTMFGRLLGWITIYIFFRGLLPLTEFCQVNFSLCVQVLRSPILGALLHGTRVVGSTKLCGVEQRRHLYSTGRPSRWASAHILVLAVSGSVR